MPFSRRGFMLGLAAMATLPMAPVKATEPAMQWTTYTPKFTMVGTVTCFTRRIGDNLDIL